MRVVVEGVSRERDELVALLNARERRCFETLSLAGQNTVGSCSSKHSLDGATSSDVTAVKVLCLILPFLKQKMFLV